MSNNGTLCLQNCTMSGEANCLLPARRVYTKRGICDRAVSLCPSDSGIVEKAEAKRRAYIRKGTPLTNPTNRSLVIKFR